MTTRVDGSGLGARRQKVVAGAQQHLDVLEESLAGGPLPLLPELGRGRRDVWAVWWRRLERGEAVDARGIGVLCWRTRDTTSYPQKGRCSHKTSHPM